MVDLSEYALQPLRDDGEYALLRGVRRRDGIAVLVGRTSADIPTDRSRGRLEQAYALRDQLDPETTLPALAVLRSRGHVALVLPDPGGAPLEVILRAGPLPLDVFLDVAISITHALSRFHARGYIHRDIKPSYVLVDVSSGKAWLSGVGLALRAPRARQDLAPPEGIAGTLAYMAPEQTGRVNRSVDARSDLYALGVTFFEMLTGGLPFVATDPMELVHCHVARPAPSVRDRAADVPDALARLVARLLEKSPDDRYQSAMGVEADLRTCRDLSRTGTLAPFELGVRDVPSRILVPERLAGRDAELRALHEALAHVERDATPSLLWVQGPSGVGKSAFVSQLRTLDRGMFTSAKCAPESRSIPFDALGRALGDIVHRLASLTSELAGDARAAVLEAIGEHAGLATQIVPHLAEWIGGHVALVPIAPEGARARVQSVLRRLITCLAERATPLVMFIDDVQWADPEMLELLTSIAEGDAGGPLLVVMALRDEALDDGHPFERHRARLLATGACRPPITLHDLPRGWVAELLADTLHADVERVTPLADAMHKKTAGNPYFTLQFITALAEGEHLRFDPEAAEWRWDLDAIQRMQFTDNVMTLVGDLIDGLDGRARLALSTHACLGPTARSTTLSHALGIDESALHLALSGATELGLVHRGPDQYAFLHDRAHEAAYGLLPADERAALHLRLGQTLIEEYGSKVDEAVFEVVGQLDRGLSAALDPALRARIAALDLQAGRRAKAAAAYASAAAYLAAGEMALVGAADDAALAFALGFERAECALLLGDLEDAQTRARALAERATTTVQHAAVARLSMGMHTMRGRPDLAVEIFLAHLRHVGIEWSAHPDEQAVTNAYRALDTLIDDREIASLVDLPTMTRLDWQATLDDVFLDALAPALFTDRNLYLLSVAGMVAVTLEHGSSNGSAWAYEVLGMVLVTCFGDHERGRAFGELGVALGARRGLDRFKARVHVTYGHHVTPWTGHIRAGTALVREAIAAMQAAGENTYLAYTRAHMVAHVFSQGDALTEVTREAEEALRFAEATHFRFVADDVAGLLALVRTLEGKTDIFGCLSDGRFDEAKVEAFLRSGPPPASPALRFWVRKLIGRFVAGDFAAAVDAADQVMPLLWTSPKGRVAPWFHENAEYHYFAALARAQVLTLPETLEAEARERQEAALADHHVRLARWAAHCPESFGSRAALVAAEVARLAGRALEAQRGYERAVALAREHGFVHQEAVAHELAARFHAASGLTTAAGAHLRHAHGAYGRWGALGKVRQMEALYPELAARSAGLPSLSTIDTPIVELDLANLLGASRALSTELALDRLVDRLMTIALTHAGAERGALLLPGDGGRLEIAAVAKTRPEGVEVSIGPVSGSAPWSLLDAVARGGRPVVIDDARAAHDFDADPYFAERHLRSVLCLPLVGKGAVVGVVLLENDLTSHVFTASRVVPLEMLAGHAAIALENARLYADLDRARAYMTQAERLSATGSFGWDMRTGLLTCSDETLRIAGVTRTAAITPERFLSCVHPLDRDAARDAAAACIQGSMELRLRLAGSMERIVEVQTQLVRDERGEVTSYVGAVMDVTARKRGDEALQNTRAALAHVSRVATLGELTASIAHEVNQPVAAVVLHANACVRWLNRGESGIDEAKIAAQRIARDATRIGDTVSRLRSLFKRAGAADELVDLHEALDEVVSLIRPELSRHRVALRITRASSPPLVRGDRVQLQQVLMNLALNAAQAMATLEERPRDLAIAVEVLHDVVEVRVEDSGPGIDPAVADRIFEPFVTSKSEGMGMGLSICRSIVESHGGSLWVAPTSGTGTTFAFTALRHSA